jgi:hypothetical protein
VEHGLTLCQGDPQEESEDQEEGEEQEKRWSMAYLCVRVILRRRVRTRRKSGALRTSLPG